MAQYDFTEIESRWRECWRRENYHATDMNAPGPKCYSLVMFSYPSGDKLHLGHWYNYVPADTWTRFRKMNGYNVFQPMGFDSFGLPAENYAIKCGIPPQIHTEENIAVIREQLESLGAMYDWKSELATHRPNYYRWTQWLFLTLFEKGLAYRSDQPVNWCDSCGTVLANEQVLDGECERCGHAVERRKLTQWCFRITDYADRLIDGLADLDWPQETKKKQTSWIGRSEGAEIVFTVPPRCLRQAAPDAAEIDANGGLRLRVFTTRPDTLFGVTYMVLAPEHPLVSLLTTPDNRDAVDAYIRDSARLSEVDRQSTDRPKTGVPTGAVAVNPVNGEEVPVWIADYVLASYGTGAVMAVPGHDERDFDFARAHDLPVRRVIVGEGQAPGTPLTEAWTGPGVMTASGEFDGSGHVEGGAAVVASLSERGLGEATVQYRLRDWLISRQRYWGAPIPIIHCPDCGEVPVPMSELPVLLPEDVDYKPKGKAPLASSESFMQVDCPRCGGPARRDPDTMDTFVCSSWYYLRYPAPDCADAPFDRKLVDKWLPVDQYIGGADHAYGHLIFSRFITKVLHDLGHLDFDEPFLCLRHQGMITRDGEKMSKSKGNVVVPSDYLDNYGTDTLRTYLMFGFAFDEGGDWTDSGIDGVFRYLQRVWRLVQAAVEVRSPAGDAPADAVVLDWRQAEERWTELRRVMHNSIRGCTQDLERFQFNTAISRLMELTNALYGYAGRDIVGLDDPNYREAISVLIRMVSPFAPHLGEELWSQLGGDGHVFDAGWPQWNPDYLVADTVTYVIQINGKIRERLQLPRDTDRESVVAAAKEQGRIPELITGRELRKVIVVPNKLVNIVV